MTNHLTVIEGKTIANSEIIAALESSRGILCKAAEALGVRRHQLEQAIDSDKALHQIYMDQIHTMIDKAQENVMIAVDAGKYDASIFVLQTLAKEKGWSTRTELTLVKVEKSVDNMSVEELDQFLAASGYVRIKSEEQEAQAQLVERQRVFAEEKQRQLTER
jgi:hypothetical protein